MSHHLLFVVSLVVTVACSASTPSPDAPSPEDTSVELAQGDSGAEEATDPGVASEAEDLPTAIACYQRATRSNDIDAYMACFADDAVMVDVSRTFTGKDAIRAWAQREVMGNGETFAHRRILESSQGYAKTEVAWLTWVVHYSYWWSADGTITKMSLQYAD